MSYVLLLCGFVCCEKFFGGLVRRLSFSVSCAIRTWEETTLSADEMEKVHRKLQQHILLPKHARLQKVLMPLFSLVCAMPAAISGSAHAAEHTARQESKLSAPHRHTATAHTQKTRSQHTHRHRQANSHSYRTVTRGTMPQTPVPRAKCARNKVTGAYTVKKRGARTRAHPTHSQNEK